MTRWHALAWIEGIAIVAIAVLLLVRSREAPQAVPASADAQQVRATLPDPPASDRAAAFAAATPAPDPTDSAQPPSIAPPDPRRSDPGVVPHGFVHSSSGEPLQNAWLSWQPTSGGPERRFQTDRFGSYAAAGFEPGEYDLSVTRPGFRSLQQSVRLVPAPPEQRHDFRLEPEPIVLVTLRTPDGRLLQEASRDRLIAALQIVATRDEPPANLEWLPLDAIQTPRLPSLAVWDRSEEPKPGIGRLPAHCTGCLLLRAPAPLHVSAYLGPTRLAATRLEPDQSEVVLQIEPDAWQRSLARCRFRLLDATTGAPITRARVSCCEDRYQSATQFHAQPDEQGSWTVTFLAGTGELAIRTDEYESIHLPLVLAPGELRDFGEIRLAKARGRWTGRVVDAAGRKVSGVVLWRMLDERSGAPALTVDRTEAAGGEFVQSCLGPHRYLAVALTPAQAIGWCVVDARGEPAPIELRVRPASVVTFAGALPELTSLRVTVHDFSGVPIWSEQIVGTEARSCRLPAGTYRAELLLPDRSTRSRPFVVGDGTHRITVP